MGCKDVGVGGGGGALLTGPEALLLDKERAAAELAGATINTPVPPFGDAGGCDTYGGRLRVHHHPRRGGGGCTEAGR
eukprot:COSAG01_NODE_55442_length_325_cov_0.632743_1_plen_76_part_10